MNLSSITGSAAAAPAPSAAVQAASLRASAESALLSSITSPSGSALPDLSSLAATAQAYALYTDPGMLQQLATGTPAAAGGSNPPAGNGGGAVFVAPTYAFNPFDQASWWASSSSLGNTVDASA